MVKHCEKTKSYWCLPGGGVYENEKHEDAAIRELKEECRVEGKIIRLISRVSFSDSDFHYTYLVDIGDQTPSLGHDPELEEGQQILSDVGWRNLEELSEIDRAFLWASGLLAVDGFHKWLESR